MTTSATQGAASMEARLRVTEAKLRAIIDSATDAIVLADGSGDIMEVNRSAERMFGRASRDLTGRPLTMLMPERFHAAHLDGINRFMTGGATRNVGRTLELIGLRKGGQEFPIELSLAACETADGPIFTGIVRDITTRRHTELELIQQHTQLEVVNSELAAFSYSVSHDLRAPLRSINGFSQVLLEECGGQLNDVGRDALQRVRAAIQRMERLIDAMLALSRVTRAEMHRDVADLSAKARAVEADLRQDDPARQVEFVIHPGMTASGDRRLLRVVVENLLRNGWKATARQPHGRIEFGVNHTEGRPTYFVLDNGIGFDEAHAKNLFTAFKTLHRRTEFPGTGIGLATVHRIVTRHGGTVWATGAPGRGAVFYFTLGGVDEEDDSARGRR